MSNHEVVVAVIGLDQPGVIACVSSVITRLGCNIREMTQSTLHEQFAGIYLVDKPQELPTKRSTRKSKRPSPSKRCA